MTHNTAIHSLARAVIIDQGHILLAHHPKWERRHYYLPGGHIEHGESAAQSVLRELMEEMGLNFTLQRFLGCLEYSFKPNLGTRICHTHEYNFLFLATSPDVTIAMLPEQKEEHVTFSWVSLHELASITLLPHPLVDIIPTWLALSPQDTFKSEMV